MRNSIKIQNVKVTTTSGFDGVEIKEYLEPITAHVVVGMNFLKDLLTGLTDFFGGKSETYQNTLSSINNEVINKLREKAYSIGGNCVLGLRIDNDEISAQGKSMVMVSAIGTVAIADFSIETLSVEKKVKSNIISIDYLRILKIKKEYIKKSKDDLVDFNDSFWQFIKKNEVYELLDYLLNKYIEFLQIPEEFIKINFDYFTNNIVDYFSIIDEDIVAKSLYAKIEKEQLLKVKKKIAKIIIDIMLIDYVRVIRLLESSDFNVKKIGLELAKVEKQNYEKSDIKLINDMITLIASNFTERGKKILKKKKLSQKEKEVWVCECGKENNENTLYCVDCNKDIFGFREYEAKPYVVIEHLINTMEILETILD